MLVVLFCLYSSCHCEALELEELNLLFAGPVPTATENETQMLAQKSRYAMKDHLLENEKVKALVIKMKAGQYLA